MRLLIASALLVLITCHAQAATGSGCYRVVGVGPGDALNMRAGPSAQNRIVDRLVPNRHGIISSVGPCIPKRFAWHRRWCPVSHYSGNGTTTGWVKARYVEGTGCP